MNEYIHEKSHVDTNCDLGDEVVVWQFASVIRGAKIGWGTSIGSCAIVDGAAVGNRCSIGHGAQIHPGSVIGNDCFIGPGTILCNDAWPSTIKQGFDIKEYLSGRMVSVRIGDATSLGANVTVLPGISIGGSCMVAAGSVVRYSIPDFSLHKRNGDVVRIAARIPQRMRNAPAFTVSFWDANKS